MKDLSLHVLHGDWLKLIYACSLVIAANSFEELH